MTKVADKTPQPLNQNLKNLKSFRGNGAKALEKTPGATEATNKLGEELPKTEITEQAKNLNAASPEEKTSTPSSASEAVDKASSVAKTLAKTPVMPILIPKSDKDTKPLEDKISDKKIDKNSREPMHFIKKPAVIFIEGFSFFGTSNGDGIKDMSDNFPGAKRFSWTDHDKIIEEIKKHSPTEPVVLVGHSFGGDTAIEVAEELNSVKNGFRPVDLLVSIDAVGMNKSIMPINVKSNLNFFVEGVLPFLHGDPTVARNTKYTDVTNELRPGLHTRLDDDTEVQFEIFQKINEVLGAKGEEDVFIEISEANQIKDVLEAIKNSI